MTCKNCGKPTPLKANGRESRKFCKDPACVKDYFKRRGESGIQLDNQSLTKVEIELRQALFQQAKEGDKEARRLLAMKYHLTGLWDGEKFIKLIRLIIYFHVIWQKSQYTTCSSPC